jgi:hypothetical protein
MKRREAPRAASYDLPLRLKNDPQVRKWTQRLKADPEARPTDLTEEQLAFVIAEVMKQRGEAFEPTPFMKAMIESRPVFAAPDWTDEVVDMEHLFRQPEMRRFWENWQGLDKGKGPKANYAGAKATMASFAMTGTGKHFDKLSRSLARDREMLAIFDKVEGTPVAPPPYSSLCRQIKKLGTSCTVRAIEANIEMVKALRAMHPKKGIGKRLMIDSCDVSAWCKQVGSGDPERDAELRKRTPEAGFRRYAYGPNGKTMIKNGEAFTFGAGREVKSWRGYYLSVIADQATGLPLVWMLYDAKHDEAAAIVPLLSLLLRLWPDIDADCIAGDSAWDENEWNRLCEVDYGIAPIFRLRPTQQKSKPWIKLDPKASRDGSVTHMTPEGQLVCDAHRQPLPYDTFDRPNRGGLRPGQSTDERLFRLRAKCTHQTKEAPHACGKVGIKVMNDWSRLARFPHHRHGDPQRHAFRIAMLARLNGVEGIFNRLKAGKILGVKGADRTRLLDRSSVEALISLALLSMTALQLASEREHRGIIVQPLVAAPSTPAQPKPHAPHRVKAARPSGAPHVRRRPLTRATKSQGVHIPMPFDFDDVERVGLD